MFDFIKKLFGSNVSKVVEEKTAGVTEMINKVEDKAEDVLGDQGKAMVDNVVNKAEDMVQSATGVDVDLNKDSK